MASEHLLMLQAVRGTARAPSAAWQTHLQADDVWPVGLHDLPDGMHAPS